MIQWPDLLVDPIKEITAGKHRSLVLENRDIRMVDSLHTCVG
jgi:hypothetical protein